MIEFDEKPNQIGTVIKIVGVGGAGGNAVNTMIANELTGVEFIAANTDMSDLVKSKAKMKLQLGRKLTRGLGTGAIPELGAKAAEESRDEIKSHLEGADMVFVAAGMGGGTGTGAAPIITKIAKDLGILTLGIVTTPFPFEGKKRESNADVGIRNMAEHVDSLIVIPNSKLTEIYGELSLLDAFHKADNVLYEAAKAVSDIINVSGLINVDFADVNTALQNMGYALMGTGSAEGDNRAVMAAKAAISNPLLSDISLHGCKALLINTIAGPDFKMNEFDDISGVIVNETGSNANTIMGVIIDPEMMGKVSVTIIATGLQSAAPNVVDFQPFMPEEKPPTTKKPSQSNPHKQARQPEEDIEDIFRVLNINQPSSREEEKQPSEDEPLNLSPRTDLPSFLKALD
ncbi:MAG: cell division protein FtsZ [Candidatus Cloacimonadaceae bacterium]|jgi:cell division protein FtsZ|nr:cell division protein FtsZ [Candidatus Cloacimonadota bacterium]MDX9950455.1 cell division protein FtsZ [Candidatus Syntrophosphaera sp.]NLN84520.1 cell division protein FtsZ [Candidatus Cloacimonadota bacterium]